LNVPFPAAEFLGGIKFFPTDMLGFQILAGPELGTGSVNIKAGVVFRFDLGGVS